MSSDFVPIEESTGLSGDYLNAWACIPAYHEFFRIGHWSKENYFTHLEKPVRTYREYYEKKYTEEAEGILARSKPEPLQRLDDLVNKYNDLPAESKADIDTFWMYGKKVREIIETWDEVDHRPNH